VSSAPYWNGNIYLSYFSFPLCVLIKVLSGKSSVCYLIVACCTIPVVGGARARGRGYSFAVASFILALLCGVLVDHFASVHCWGSWAFPGALLLFNLMQWRLSVHANCNIQTYHTLICITFYCIQWASLMKHS